MSPSLNPFHYLNKFAKFIPAVGSRLAFVKLYLKCKEHGLKVRPVGGGLDIVLPWPKYYAKKDLNTIIIAPGVSLIKPKSIDDKVLNAVSFVKKETRKLSKQYSLDLHVQELYFKNGQCLMGVNLCEQNKSDSFDCFESLEL